jgi:hypothetical protein
MISSMIPRQQGSPKTHLGNILGAGYISRPLVNPNAGSYLVTFRSES